MITHGNATAQSHRFNAVNRLTETDPMASATSKIRVRPSRYEWNDPIDRKETCKLVDDFERNLRRTVKRKPIDQSVDRSLPRRLAGRTNRFIEAAQAAARRDFPWLSGVSDPRRVAGTVSVGWDGDAGAVSHPERRPALQVTIEPKSKPRPLPPRVENWMGNFLRKPTRKRIQWRSKLYGTADGWRADEPPERMEQLMDAGAQDFVHWLNGLGAERSSLTKDIVKQLFSSGSGDETSRALNIAPREVRAVPGSVAEQWNLRQLALENRIAEVLNRDRKLLAVGGEKRTAFGRSLPRELRGERWTDPDEGDVERPDVPEDLMSLKRLFRDIWHLRSVKYLVDYLIERPSLARPQFLLAKGLFERKDAVEPVPFYRKVLSQKAIADSVRN